ncbi:MAG: precorrin-2 C(20)-methyltransferase [Deltaproteobacteria bacterium]
MKLGTLYGIGIGPGDPELITVRGAKILARCRRVFVPRAPRGEESLALSIARQHIHPESEIVPVVFPMSRDKETVREHWAKFVPKVEEVLRTGEDACYLTLGDPLLYSTYVYMLASLRERVPDVRVVTVPGVSSFSAAAALAGFPLGQAESSVSIVPAADDLGKFQEALAGGGTVVLMKVGKRLREVIDLLERVGRIEQAVFVARVGLEGERIETDLRNLDVETPETGHMSIILVRGETEQSG